MKSEWPKTLEEAVNICLLTMTPEEKELINYTPQENLIWFHFDWALNMRSEFGMEEGNNDLLKSCGTTDPDEASMAIVEAVRVELTR
jgi:hypothetical protein